MKVVQPMDRREFLVQAGKALAVMGTPISHALADESSVASGVKAITLFLCGDVMTGRGIDQVLPHPSDPTIYESYMRTATGYVALAEAVNGPLRT